MAPIIVMTPKPNMATCGVAATVMHYSGPITSMEFMATEFIASGFVSVSGVGAITTGSIGRGVGGHRQGRCQVRDVDTTWEHVTVGWTIRDRTGALWLVIGERVGWLRFQGADHATMTTRRPPWDTPVTAVEASMSDAVDTVRSALGGRLVPAEVGGHLRLPPQRHGSPMARWSGWKHLRDDHGVDLKASAQNDVSKLFKTHFALHDGEQDHGMSIDAKVAHVHEFDPLDSIVPDAKWDYEYPETTIESRR